MKNVLLTLDRKNKVTDVIFSAWIIVAAPCKYYWTVYKKLNINYQIAEISCDETDPSLTSIPFRVFSSLQNKNLKEWLWPRERERETFLIFNQSCLTSLFSNLSSALFSFSEKSERIQLCILLPKFLFPQMGSATNL